MLRHLCVCVCVPRSKVHTVLSCTHVLHYFSLYFQQFEFVQHFYILFFTCLFCPLSHILLLLQSVEIDTQGTMKTSERHEDERNSNQHKNKNIKNKNRSTMNNQYFKDFYDFYDLMLKKKLEDVPVILSEQVDFHHQILAVLGSAPHIEQSQLRIF
jgi:hypothetical protein